MILLIANIGARKASIEVEFADHRDLLAHAPGITQYERRIREAQLLELLRQLEQLDTENTAAKAELRRILHAMTLAGYATESNDNG